MFKKIILLLVIFSFFSCSKELEKELENSFKNKNVKKIEILLKKYKKKVKYNYKYENYNIKLAILKNNYEQALDYYNESFYMKNRKNDYFNKVLTEFFIKSYKEKKSDKYLKDKVKKLPYSSKIRKFYLNEKWKNNFNFNTVVKDIRRYRNDFSHDKKLFLRFIFYYLLNSYNKDKKITYVKEISKIDIPESRKFIENLIKKDSYLIHSLDNLPDINIKYIEKLLSSNFENKKILIKKFLKKKTIKDLKEIYKKVSINEKISIYYYYYHLYKKEIDKDLIASLINKNKVEYLTPALELIEKLKLNNYKNILIGLLKENKFEIYNDKIIKTILKFDSNFLKENKDIKLSEYELKKTCCGNPCDSEVKIETNNKKNNKKITLIDNDFKNFLDALKKDYENNIFDLMVYLNKNIKKEQISFLIPQLKLIDYYWILGINTNKDTRTEIIINILKNLN